MNKEKLKRIQKLRKELLSLGQPIILPAREQQIKDADSPPPRDLTIYPVFE